MKVKGLLFEDFVNYRKPCMTIQTPVCKCFKCDQDCGMPVCQNSALATAPTLEYSNEAIINAFITNTIACAICFQGLEPFDTFDDLYNFIMQFRNKFNRTEDIVIYTGYNKEEINSQLKLLKQFPNIIVKFGRYVPNQEKHYDEILGVSLASPNQYAERIS